LKHLPSLENLPLKKQENKFKKVMNVAELAKLNREERAAYEHSLNSYRDLQNVKDTYFEEEKIEGKIKTAINVRKQGLPMDVKVAITQLSEAALKKIFEEKGI